MLRVTKIELCGIRHFLRILHNLCAEPVEAKLRFHLVKGSEIVRHRNRDVVGGCELCRTFLLFNGYSTYHTLQRLPNIVPFAQNKRKAFVAVGCDASIALRKEVFAHTLVWKLAVCEAHAFHHVILDLLLRACFFPETEHSMIARQTAI